MKSRSVALLLSSVLNVYAQQWQIALPGYHYEFPRDHFNHPAYQTEWWYYTGNLHAPDGRRFGFELTFFRTGIHLPERVAAQSDAAWRPDRIFLAHLALSDLDGGTFYHQERLNRAGPGLAGVSFNQGRYWNGNWQVRWNPASADPGELLAVSDKFTLRLNLHSAKPAVIQGQDGVSQKGPLPSEASHYISFTRLLVNGTLTRGTTNMKMDGLAWVDHEFFSEGRSETLAGWDWFAIQLDNNEELMLYRLRQKSGAPDPYSSGIYVKADGTSRFLENTDFTLQPGERWKSPHSKASYPLSWTIEIPSLQLSLQQQTPLKDQELFSKSAITPSYWEGAVTYSGRLKTKPVRGVGYLEMTGYDKAVWLRQR